PRPEAGLVGAKVACLYRCRQSVTYLKPIRLGAMSLRKQDYKRTEPLFRFRKRSSAISLHALRGLLLLGAKLQDLASGSLPVSLQVKRDVLETEPLEDVRERLRHLQAEGAFQFFPRNLDPRQFAVEPNTELPEAEGFDRLFSVLYRLDGFGSNRR